MKINNTHVIFFLFLAFILITGCDNNSDEYDDEFRIGIINENIEVHKLQPPLRLTLNTTDSIDINGDSIFDLVFIKWQTPLIVSYGQRAEVIKNTGVKLVVENVEEWGYVLFPKGLHYKEIIDSTLLWSDENTKLYTLQGYKSDWYTPPGYIKTGFFHKNEDLYLGINISGKLGWVKIANSEYEDLYIKEYAIMK